MKKYTHKWKILIGIFIVLTIVLVTGCNRPTTTIPSAEEETDDSSVEDKQVSQPDIEEEVEIPDPAAPPLAVLPMRIQFTAEDGQELVGYYFAAASNPAPTVILMHWYPGDQRDWLAIAPWLQNRQDELAEAEGWEMAIGLDCRPQKEGPWLDPLWFPPMPEEISFNVFIFDFRGHCESQPAIGSDNDKTLDAKAAFAEVSLLNTTDPNRIVAIGASIGADGAPDGCLLHNQDSDTCLGALSLSPGSYLGMEYAGVVKDLDGSEIPPAVPVWCFAADGDIPSQMACESASGDHYKSFLYAGTDHGMQLISPSYDPNPLVLIQDFLEESLEVEIN